MTRSFLDDLLELPEVTSVLRDERVDPEKVSAWITTFQLDNAVITIRFELGIDPYLLITNMTVLPETKQGLGHGRTAVLLFLKKACRFNLFEVQATQVQKHVARFWEKCGFESMNTITGDYRLSIRTYDLLQAQVDAETAADHIN